MASTRRTTICREGWYYLIVLLLVFGGAFVREVNLLVVLAGMMAGPLLLSRFMAVYSLRGLQARRKTPQGVCAGDLLVAGVTLSNTRRRVGSWAVVVEEQIRPAAGGPRNKRRAGSRWHRRSSSPMCPPARRAKAPTAAGLPGGAAINWDRCG